MEQNPSFPVFFIIAYLMNKGCSWKSANKTGRRASDTLLTEGFHQEENVIFDKFAVKLPILAYQAII